MKAIENLNVIEKMSELLDINSDSSEIYNLLEHVNYDVLKLCDLSESDIEGIVSNKYLDKVHSIISLMQISRDLSNGNKVRSKVTKISHLATQFIKIFGCSDVEQMYVVFLQNGLEVIDTKKMFQGGLDGMSIDIRLIIKEALMLNSNRMIIVHNHPGNSTPKPSNDDIVTTHSIIRALDIMDMQLLDHIIISANTFRSMQESNDVKFNF